MSALLTPHLDTEYRDSQLHSSNYNSIEQEERSEQTAIKEALTHIRPQGLQNLVAIPPENGAPVGKTFDLPKELDAAGKWAAQQNEAGRNVYFTVNPVNGRIGKKPTKADIAWAEYAHVDIDPEVSQGYAAGRRHLLAETLPALQAFEPAPSLIIDSGNGLGAFWRIDGAKVEQVESLNQRLIGRFGGDVGTHNIDRLMRLPGTLNYPSKKKLAKGYPSEPGVAALLVTNEGAYSAERLAGSLPAPAVMAAPPSKTAPAHGADAAPLSETEIEALRAKLDETLDLSPSLRRRWHGETQGLSDTSRSGLDFSVTALLKTLGFPFRETAHLLVHEFKHGKGGDNTARDLERNWSRCGTSSPEEILALCLEAKQRGEPWEPVLHAARPNAQTVDAVLERLAKEPGSAGKRALKADYEFLVAQIEAEESEQQIRQKAGNKLALLWEPTCLNDMVEQVESALRAYPGKWEVLLYGGLHSRVAIKPPQQLHMIDDPVAQPPRVPVLEPYSPSGMLLRIEQSVAFYTQKDQRAVPIPVPDKLPSLILQKPDPQLPVTTGLASHPLVLPNGELLIKEGLHEGSGIYVHFGGASFQEPGAMTPEEGVRILRDEMLGEFDFGSEADQAAALTLVLTAIERKTLDMAPGFLINASTQGSGKTTLARMAHLLVTGHDMPVASMSENVEEQDKALTAMLLASVPIVCFDNVPDAFTVKSPVLARALTSPTHTGRMLGMSKMVELPTNTVFVVTGNNIKTDLDLSRRLLEVRLTPTEERPEQRQFNHPDVVTHVLRNRSRWMQAALTILKGSRTPATGSRCSGFAAWDRIVRWPLVNAGVADPMTKFDEVREQSPEHERLVAWMLFLVEAFGEGREFRARDLMGQAELPAVPAQCEPSPFLRAYADYVADHPPPRGWGNVKSIAWLLDGLVGRTVEGHTLAKRKGAGKTMRYVVERR